MLVAPLAVLPVGRSTTAGALATATPGTTVVEYSGVSMHVPALWPVYDLGADPTRCARTDRHAVYLGHQGAHAACPAQVRGKTESAQMEPLDATVAGAAALSTTRHVIGVHDIRVDPAFPTTHSVVAAVDQARVLLTISYGRDAALAQGILGSLEVAPTTPGTAARQPPTAAGRAAGQPPTAPGRAAPAAQPPTAPGRAAPAAQPFTGGAFDTCAAPSLDTMRAWLSSPYGAVGIYVGGANRSCGDGNLSASWTGWVMSMGWSLLPIYVGLQAPCVSQGGLATIDPSSADAQGAEAADDAANRALSFGLGPGSVVFFDMEAYGTGCSSTVTTFLAAWTRQTHNRGYRSGVYSSADSGIHDLVADAAARPDSIWFARWDGVATTSDPGIPDGLWSGPERVKQYWGGHLETYSGVTIDIDSDLCEVDLGSTVMPGPLEEFIPDHLRGRIWNAYDQTFATGAFVTGRPAGFTDAGGRPHVFVRGSAGNLLEFVPDGLDGHIWNAHDRTFATGASISGNPAVWVDAGGRPHVYVRGSAGKLLELIPDNLGGRAWNAYDQSAATHAPISGDPAVWVGADGLPHVTVRGSAGSLLEFVPDQLRGHIWNAYDLSAVAGSLVSGNPVAWNAGGAPHVYVRGAAGNLLEFVRDSLGGRLWNAYDQSTATGSSISGDPSVWSAGGVPHVYVRGLAGHLLEFIPDNLAGRLWNTYDQSSATGSPISGDPSVWTDGGAAPHIYVRGSAGHLLEFIPDNLRGRVWNAYDQSFATGRAISGDPYAWGPGGTPHVYVAGG
jgi:hypothetical protein